jgi:uncharacterized protein
MNAIGNPLGVQREQTMEEILASIRKIIESNEALANGVRADDEVARSDAPLQAVTTDIVVPVIQPVEVSAAEPLVREPVDVSAQMAALEIAPVSPAAATLPVAEARPSLQSEMARLMSRPAEKQVAASFDDLNLAFNKARELPLQAMAESMLQPMLREWLDNNLPVMVERLVREEIARIARGDI